MSQMQQVPQMHQMPQQMPQQMPMMPPGYFHHPYSQPMMMMMPPMMSPSFTQGPSQSFANPNMFGYMPFNPEQPPQHTSDKASTPNMEAKLDSLESYQSQQSPQQSPQPSPINDIKI
jgi:hypothetical protein